MSNKWSTIRKFTILFVLIVFIGGYIAYALTRPLPVLAATIKQPAIPAAITPYFPWPSYGESAFGAVGYGLLTTHNAQTAVPMASTAKVLTALAVLDKKPLAQASQGPAITMTDQDVAIYQNYVAQDGSVVPVTVGEQISEYQALQAMLLPSANNIAETLGVWAYGSTDAFVTAANALATTIGAPNTHLVDASGFLPGSVSTASDLVQLGLKAMANPVIAEIVGETTANIPVAGEIHNVNVMLGQNGIKGIKTGNTDQAGGVFLASSTITVANKPLTVVSAIMSAPNLGTALTDSGPLISAASNAFETVSVTKAGQQLGSVIAPWGGSAKLSARNTVDVTRWKGAVISSEITRHRLASSLKANTPVATFTATANSKSYASVITADHDLPKPSLFWRLRHAL
jgi:D-alanyl-D-alanine carboxypeptidase (penicillin-binding protein 5/6)